MSIKKILSALITTGSLLASGASIPLPADFEPIDIAADGFGGYYLLDDFGRVVAADSTGKIVAQLENKAPIVHITDIAFSVGWLYLADREGMALFMTDKTLRSPSRISLELPELTVRPDKFAIAKSTLIRGISVTVPPVRLSSTNVPVVLSAARISSTVAAPE